MSNTISRSDAVRHIEASGGKLFSVRFAKRSDGSVRTMCCRTGVANRRQGGSLAFDPASKGLILVFDMNIGTAGGQGAYRMIPIEGLLQIKIDGEWLDVV